MFLHSKHTAADGNNTIMNKASDTDVLVISVRGEFDLDNQEGIAFQIDVEDAIGVAHQIQALETTVEEKL
jgi:predicted nucleotidyltransferase